MANKRVATSNQWKCGIVMQQIIETVFQHNSCCVPQFPLITSCYKNSDSETSFKVC